ncbi:MAG: hypothetical protein H6732_09180 [Alphaproteobacteria bacterium]|nr:hypothetical protein [Alphaproteobacteria bacterium]
MSRLWLWVLLMVAGCTQGFTIPTLLGEACDLETECQEGTLCGRDGTCRLIGEPGAFPQGAQCLASAQCGLGLACASTGTCELPGSPGTAPFGDACTLPTDCQLGLSCTDGTCRGFELPLWFGDECPADDDGGTFRMIFEVPGQPVTKDFYRLPFPNDARIDASGRLDLSGHPTPGELVPVLGDVVASLLQDAEDLVDGFGPNQAIFMRFSTFPDNASLDFGTSGTPFLSDGGPTIALVDLTEGSRSANSQPASFSASSARGQYICRNWLALTPLDGRPLTPGHTYAVVLSDGVTDDGGTPLTADADFAAMLGASAPTESRLARAYEAYAPLRAWAAELQLDTSRIRGGTVFTIQDTNALPEAVHDAVLATSAPKLTGAVVCGGGDDPFAESGDTSRGCTKASDLYTEIQGLVGLPQFQTGTPPFKEAADGGGIDPDATPRTQQVHVAISLPKDGTMPPDGWPVVLYGHGTGGSYTSFLREGLAEQLASIDDLDTTVNYAMVGFDAPMHGPRSGVDTYPAAKRDAWLEIDPGAFDPDVLFFNPINLEAARANVLQEAADLWSLVRLLAAGIPAEDSPTGSAIAFDVDHLVYLGHSQGGVVGPLFAAFEGEVDAVVLSGAGGLTIQTLLNKTSPNDIPSGVRVALADPNIGRNHPVLNLAQMLAEASDGVNFGGYLLREPRGELARRHVFQIFGRGDTFSPDATQSPLTRVLGLQQLVRTSTPLDTNRYPEVSLPVGENLGGITGVVGTYDAAGGKDAHFVLFERDDAATHLATFLASFVLDGAPTISE